MHFKTKTENYKLIFFLLICGKLICITTVNSEFQFEQENSLKSNASNVFNLTKFIRQARQAQDEDYDDQDEDPNSGTNNSNQTAMNMFFKQVLPAFNGLFKQFTGNQSILDSAVKEFQQVPGEIIKQFSGNDSFVKGAVKEVGGIVKQFTGKDGIIAGAVKEFSMLVGVILEEFEPKSSTNKNNDQVVLITTPVPPKILPATTTNTPRKHYPDIVDEAYAEGQTTVIPTTAAAYAEPERMTYVPFTTTKLPVTEASTQQNNRYQIQTKTTTSLNPFLNKKEFHEAVIPSKIIPSVIRTTPSLIDDYDKEEEFEDKVTVDPSKLAAYLSKYQYNKFDKQNQLDLSLSSSKTANVNIDLKSVEAISREVEYPSVKPPHVEPDNEIIDLLFSVSSKLDKPRRFY